MPKTIPELVLLVFFIAAFILFARYMIFQYPKDRKFNNDQERRLREYWDRVEKVDGNGNTFE